MILFLQPEVLGNTVEDAVDESRGFIVVKGLCKLHRLVYRNRKGGIGAELHFIHSDAEHREGDL